jgi:squalene-hopene/tetraprenyl-beta-curcumene cyclase
MKTPWRNVFGLSVCSLLGAVCLAPPAVAAEPVTLDSVVDPGPKSPDEPLAQAYSLEKAVHFLDSASLTWQKQRKCFTCHTNYLYLYARPAVSADNPAHQTVRAFAEELVRERWKEKGPRWDAEVVATAAALAFNDRATTGKLHRLTRRALDRMWTVQRADGGFDWLKCGWPPMESDDDFGAALAALAVGVAPEDYAQTEAAQKGLAKIRTYLKNNPPPTLHHRAMLLWAASYTPDLISDQARQACRDELFSLQRDDGGWALATLGDWKREDGGEQSTAEGDGYGTGFAIYVLRRAGVPATDERLQRGVAWLKKHQRASGRWFTRSLHRDSRHFITHAGSAMAVLALRACDAAPAPRDE